ncbi:MAG: hypothetical protein K0R58_3840, partial [Ramlibacter sp.]|nr:hypothetical protein [Ramlibacter sp.]
HVAGALTARLDDSLSPHAQVIAPQVLSEHGRPLDDLLADVAPQYGVSRFGRVEYRLATAPYVGKRARIYFVVPAPVANLRSPAGLRMSWRGNGLFADGSARGGERRLVWSGMVRQPVMREALDLTMEVKLSEMLPSPRGGISVESYFEIEVTP